MTEGTKQLFRKDYEAYPFNLIDTVLNFDVTDSGEVHVKSKLKFERANADSGSLVLDGSDFVRLDEICIDGRPLSHNEYSLDQDKLTIHDVADAFICEVSNRFSPSENKELSGIYQSNEMLISQCEPEGFRRITFFPDRPDVLTKFRVSITANSKKFPLLLSNGNLVTECDAANGRSCKTYEDPFPKPSYLFAFVAGNLENLTDSFVTMTGRRITLTIYSESDAIGRCAWAMDCLKRAMRWDELVYGREYDLDEFKIVATSHFLFGAMENKGLNVFNSSAILADPDIATDTDYRRIETVVAHEYFHNWSGNRVTLRQWFELSLKEGFTVMRDSHFTADQRGRSMNLIETASELRASQFVEDRGPLVHQVRPDSYVSIDNMYTRTIYDKGCEIVRMLAALLGQDVWRKGTDLYFSRFDGQAVTIDDFVACMEEVSDRDLTHFKQWYSQSGNPVVTVQETVEGNKRRVAIHQHTPPTPDQSAKHALFIPFGIGYMSSGLDVLGVEGRKNGFETEIVSDVSHVEGDMKGTLLFNLAKTDSLIEFIGVPAQAQLSVHRSFTAPVTTTVSSGDELTRLSVLAHSDSDGFARFESAQMLFAQGIVTASTQIESAIVETVAKNLAQLQSVEAGELLQLHAMNVSLPSLAEVLNEYPQTDLDHLWNHRENLRKTIGRALINEFEEVVEPRFAELSAYATDVASMSIRSLLRVCFNYLSAIDHPLTDIDLVADRLAKADNLTDRLLYLDLILDKTAPELLSRRMAIMDAFREEWQHEELTIDHWYRRQGRAWDCDARRIRRLSHEDRFDYSRPNRVRSLFETWAGLNLTQFHRLDGSGYSVLSETIEKVDKSNPSAAARLFQPFSTWYRMDSQRAESMRVVIKNLRSQQISVNLRDQVEKADDFRLNT